MTHEPQPTPAWLNWARRIHSLAQAGLAYSADPFDRERYTELLKLSAEMLASTSDLDPVRLEALLFAEIGPKAYATPKVAIRGAAFRGEEVLLVREQFDGGRWTLPGGWMDAGDTPGGAAAREFREETGYEVRVTKLALVQDRDHHKQSPFLFAILELFFLCEITGGQPCQSLETGESAWFSIHALPTLSLGRVTPAEIAALHHHLLQPDLPTSFDC